LDESGEIEQIVIVLKNRSAIITANSDLAAMASGARRRGRSGMASVSFRRLRKNYGALNVVKDLDLEIADKEFVVLVGPSGCGKSTTLRMLAGLESVTSGDILIGDRLVNKLPPRERDIAMVFQDYALYPHKTVYDNMAFGLRMRGLGPDEIRPRIQSVAEMLGLSQLLRRLPGQLSGGQRQRVAMGRAIVRRPQVFLFDEPLSNLDAKLRGEVRTEIKRLHRDLETTILYVTHDQVEAMTLASRIVILRGGDIAQVGTPDEVYNHPVSVFVGGFIGSPTMNFLPATVSGGNIVFANAVSLPLSATSLTRSAALDGRPVTVGIRPEHFRPHDQAGLTLSGEVQVVEPLGSDTLVHFQFAGTVLNARLPPEVRPEPGTTSTVGIDPGRIHIFDADTELALH
jgi:multiple sugar transport system ATP-binding protein